MNFIGTFDMPLSADEARPAKPHDITINIMGAEAHLVTISMGPSQVSEHGKLFATMTITKGSALSDEFWEANGKKICDFIHNKLSCYGNE